MSSIGELGVGGHDGDYTGANDGQVPLASVEATPEDFTLTAVSISMPGAGNKVATWLFRVLVMTPG